MTDFFADLERHLLGATQRDIERRPLARALGAARPRLRASAMVAAATAALAIGGVAFVAAIGSSVPAEREVTPGGPTAACGPERPPAEALETLGVLREPADARDRLPEAVAEALTHNDNGAAKLYVDHSRLARGYQATGYFIVPALMDCDGTAGVCLTAHYIGPPATAVPWRCVSLADVNAGGAVFSHAPDVPDNLQDSVPTQLAAIVPNGVTSFEAGTGELTGTVEGNVFVAAHEANDAQSAKALQRLASHLAKALGSVPPPEVRETPAPGGLARDCHGPDFLSDDRPPADIGAAFAVLREWDHQPLPEAVGFGGARTIYSRYRAQLEARGQRYLLVAALLPGASGCDGEGAPGVCFGRLEGADAPTLECAPLKRVRERGLELRRDGRNGIEVAVLVPDGIKEVRMDNGGRCGTAYAIDWPVEHNIAATTLLTSFRCAEVVALRR